MMGQRDLASLNRGRLRHPLFGDREHWYDQKVPEGWWDKAMEDGEEDVRKALLAALDDVEKFLTKK